MAQTAKKPATPEEAKKKIGAGLLILNGATSEVLLLLRNSRHNDKTWGLPGGNAEHGDGACVKMLC